MIAIYIRTSTDKQQSGNEAQELALMEYLKRNNITDYKIYNDAGVSGTKEIRPALNELWNDCKKGLISSVVVYSFSRFARSTAQLVNSLNKFNDMKISFISITENIDTSTSMGKMIFGIMASLAQFERDLISDRTKNGLANAKSKGIELGAPVQYDSKAALELRRQGKSYAAIAEILGCTKSTAHDLVKRAEKAA